MEDAPKENENSTNNNNDSNNGSTVITFQRQRRRKRNRLQQRREEEGKPFQIAQDDFCADNDRFAFLDKNGDELADKRPRFKSLVKLLEERRSGNTKFRRQQRKKWQSEMLFSFTKKPPQNIGRRQWRSYANRKIPFTKLGCPATDAVLAMERNGDYVLTVGTMGDENYQGLALRFYGIHSAAAAKSQLCRTTSNAPRAPLLQTTPLHCWLHPRTSTENSVPENDNLFDARREFSPCTTSVELLVSRDWKVGVALLDPTKTNGPLPMDIPYRNENNASMVFFTLPQRSGCSGVNAVFEFNKAPMTCSTEFRRKMLWQVETIPNHTNNNQVCDTCFSAPGYMLMNYEQQNVRINWATEKSFLVPSCLRNVSVDSRFVNNSVDAKILSHSQSPSWTRVCCDAMDGTTTDLNDESLDAQVGIVNECVLHLDLLLTKVLAKRKGISDIQPDFCFSLVSVNKSGRIADFVLVFTRQKKACSLGFYVKIDLFTGMFKELDWVRSKPKTDKASLQKWCHKLSLNRRMSDLRAGPFSVKGKYSLDCTRLCQETFGFDNDEDDDYDESYWRDFCLESKKCQAPKLVTLSSLYPCCDVITNQAIINFEPVMSIRAKNSPIQLVYT